MPIRVRRGARHLRILGGALLLLVLGLPAGAGCAGREEELKFPVYAPTAPYLREQARIQRRAEALRAFRGSERVRNVIRFRNKTYAAWKPIYARVQAAEAEAERLKEMER